MSRTAKKLRDLIRQVIADHPTDQIPELAQHVVTLTPAEDLFRFYEYTLRTKIVEVLSNDRNTAMAHVFGDAPVSNEESDDEDESEAPQESWKVKSVRNWWSRMLEASVYVTDKHKKLLGDCTAEECRFIATDRRAMADDLLNKADEFEKLAALIEEHGVATVRDLPEQADL
jgi:hypothetical protein